MMFGLLFMMIVYFRMKKMEVFQRRLREDKEIEAYNLGVPVQPELYYTMGLSLVMEGVMSACYHVCPTNITFQFDTTFMYLIATLMLMKLYQVRHADVSPDAVAVFIGLGIAIILEIIPIYFPGPEFWVIFCFVSKL